VSPNASSVQYSFEKIRIVRREFGVGKTEFRIVSGATSKVTAVLGMGARIRVSLEGELAGVDSAESSDSKPGLQGQVKPSDQVSLRLIGPGEKSEILRFFLPDSQGDDPQKQLVKSLTMGTTKVTEVVSPGSYTLLAKAPDGREVSREVELVAGETLDVAIEFE
jgi:hypothetical protein